MAIIAITQLVSNCAEVFFSKMFNLKLPNIQDRMFSLSNKSSVRDIHGMQLNIPCFHVV